MHNHSALSIILYVALLPVCRAIHQPVHHGDADGVAVTEHTGFIELAVNVSQQLTNDTRHAANSSAHAANDSQQAPQAAKHSLKAVNASGQAANESQQPPKAGKPIRHAANVSVHAAKENAGANATKDTAKKAAPNLSTFAEAKPKYSLVTEGKAQNKALYGEAKENAEDKKRYEDQPDSPPAAHAKKKLKTAQKELASEVEQNASKGDYFVVDNANLKADTDGLAYRYSKHLTDRNDQKNEVWGTVVRGFDHEDGWFKRGDLYLPTIVSGKRVLTRVSSPNATSLMNGGSTQVFNPVKDLTHPIHRDGFFADIMRVGNAHHMVFLRSIGGLLALGVLAYGMVRFVDLLPDCFAVKPPTPPSC